VRRARARTSRRPRRVGRTLGGAFAAAAGLAAIGLLRSTGWLSAFGARARGKRLERLRRSPRFVDGRFRNVVETLTLRPADVLETLRLQLAAGPARHPSRPIPAVRRAASDFAEPPESGLRLTWLGHATTLVEIDGRRFLTDPVWSERISPSSLVGPRRFFPPPLALEDLPALDAVLVSHDHYDHLDMPSIRRLAARERAVFVVPLGAGAHLERWRVSPDRIRELDWGETASFGDVEVSSAPARHFSGRGLTRDRTLWCSYAIAGPRHRVFYSGDSGTFDAYRRIGFERGPFDASLMSAGAYGPTWPDVHMTPEELVRAHVDLRAGLLVPVHWGTFNLAFHGWNEPVLRAAAEAARLGVRIAVPRPGQSLEPAALPILDDGWWRSA
jgi:L-ascorbate metabolism protein UlaG (beta-lactamase superfamily)